MSGSLTEHRNRHPNKLRPLTHREQTLDQLLDHYNDAQTTMRTCRGQDDNGMSYILEMPQAWNDTYRQLERTLKTMRKLGHQQALNGVALHRLYWHLSEWYLRSTRRQVPRYRVVRNKRKHGYHRIRDGYQLEVSRHHDVNPEHVLIAIEWVAITFAGEPYIPADILEPTKQSAPIAEGAR